MTNERSATVVDARGMLSVASARLARAMRAAREALLIADDPRPR